MLECALCKTKVSALINSHLIPSAFYKQMTASSGGYVSATQTKATNTSKQVTASLLCSGCEQKFSSSGEQWVSKNYYKNGSFPIFDSLAKLQPTRQKGTTKFFEIAATQQSIDVPKMVYFATSIFWRAGACSWMFPAGKVSYQALQFGPYAEDLRKFLLGDDSFPTKASLGIIVSENPGQDGVIFPQSANRNDGGFRRYGFFIPGIAFILSLGNRLPTGIENECAARRNVLMVSNGAEKLVQNMRQGLAAP